MKIVPPQFSSNLTAFENLRKLIACDETLSVGVVRHEDIGGLQARSVSVSDFKLENVKASEARLEKASLFDVALTSCDLTAAILSDSSWRRVRCEKSRCSGTQLQTSKLKDVTFSNCKLDLVNFRFSKLSNVTFVDCALDEADFYMAELTDVSFQNCTLHKTEFSAAKLKRADFRTSEIATISGVHSLAGAIIDSVQLATLAPALAGALGINVKDD